jgi:hypothetical protein
MRWAAFRSLFGFVADVLDLCAFEVIAEFVEVNVILGTCDVSWLSASWLRSPINW